MEICRRKLIELCAFLDSVFAVNAACSCVRHMQYSTFLHASCGTPPHDAKLASALSWSRASISNEAAHMRIKTRACKTRKSSSTSNFCSLIGKTIGQNDARCATACSQTKKLR